MKLKTLKGKNKIKKEIAWIRKEQKKDEEINKKFGMRTNYGNQIYQKKLEKLTRDLK